MPQTSLTDNSFHFIHELPRAHTASHTPFDDNVGNVFDTNHWIIEVDEPKAVDDLAAPLSTLELLEA